MENKEEIIKVLEKNLSTCKTCAKLRQRNLAGRWKGKDKKYVDEFGLYWNGKVCGVCNLDRVRGYMTNLRKRRKEETLLKQAEQEKVSNG